MVKMVLFGRLKLSYAKDKFMVMPAIAVRTYNMFKNESPFRKLIKQMSKRIQKISNPIKRVKFIHNKINKEISKQMADPNLASLISCKKGCSACCHTQVAITEAESINLAQLIKDGLTIDWSKLFLQAEAGNSMEAYYKLSYSLRSCVFLSESGECRIYEDRPSVCRTNYVISDPKNCQVRSGEKPSVQLLNTFSADSWVYAQFQTSPRNGTLPVMVKDALSNFSIVDTGKVQDL